MTTGALMFAFGNEGIDYVRMAAWNAQRIRQHLCIPVAVVTDDVGPYAEYFDQVITAPRTGTDTRYFEDLDSTVTWYNASRPDAWDITPWDRTLLLDTDYVIDSSALLPVLHAKPHILAFDRARDITDITDPAELNRFGEHGLHMWWATVIIFDRSTVAGYVFDCMKMVRANWQHYRELYGIHNKTYRNDHALSIALGIVNGHTDSVMALPWALTTIMPAHQLSKTQSGFTLEYTNRRGSRQCMAWRGMDFHAMGKQHLMNIIDAAH